MGYAPRLLRPRVELATRLNMQLRRSARLPSRWHGDVLASDSSKGKDFLLA